MKNLITRKLVKEEERTVNNKPRRFYLYDYRYTTGQILKPEDAEYVKNLKIPNKINNDSLVIYPRGGKVLFSYLDTKGRSIKAYSKREIIKGFDNKYKRLRRFKKNYQSMVERMIRDIRSPDSRVSQSALIMYMIYKTGLRIGSNNDTRANVKAYGISTLLNKHVKLEAPDKIRLDFIGKKGVRNTATIRDPLIYNELRRRKSSRYNEPIFDISHNIVRKYLQSLDPRFIIKDFRTLKANQIAEELIRKRKGPAPNETTFKKWQLEVATEVAKELGNTRSVALNDYIDPRVWEKWRKKEWGIWKPKRFVQNEGDL